MPSLFAFSGVVSIVAEVIHYDAQLYKCSLLVKCESFSLIFVVHAVVPRIVVVVVLVFLLATTSQ